MSSNWLHNFLRISFCAFILTAFAGITTDAWGEEKSGPTFRIFSYPNTSWKYDAEIGTGMMPIWEQGTIMDGAFHSMTKTEPVNKYGNYGEAIGSYLEADVKVALFGSSFTAPETSNKLQKDLAQALGKSVHVLNFSIGSTGILSMFDVAKVKIPEFKPDIMLLAYNATAYCYPRIWRFNMQVDDHTWYFIQSLKEGLDFDPKVAEVHGTSIISDLITDEWLAKMNKAKAEGDETTLREDPLVKQFIKDFEKSVKYRETLEETFGHVRISLLPDYSYHKDQRFLDNVEFVNNSGIPYYLVHVPTHPEVKNENQSDFVFPDVGVPEEQGRRHVIEVNEITGKEVVHLVDYFEQEYLDDITGLFDHPTGGHPASRCTEAMGKAFTKLIVEGMK